MVFCKSLNDSNSLKLSRTLLSILANFRIAVVKTVSIIIILLLVIFFTFVF